MTRMTRNRGTAGERGASMVEFALVVPLFLVLVFGIMEAGWLFAQLTETRNAAREGARLAVVDYGDATAIGNETCTRADLSAGGATVTISTTGDVTDPLGDPTASVTVLVQKSYDSLTGFLDPVFTGLPLDSTVTMRVERPLTSLGAGPTSVSCP